MRVQDMQHLLELHQLEHKALKRCLETARTPKLALEHAQAKARLDAAVANVNQAYSLLKATCKPNDPALTTSK
jgi:hypothetical protein